MGLRGFVRPATCLMLTVLGFVIFASLVGNNGIFLASDFDARGWCGFEGPHLSDKSKPLPPSLLVFNRTYGGFDDECYAMVRCVDGGFALAGKTRSFTSHGTAAYLVRTDSNGILLWNKTYQVGDMSVVYDIVECADGGFALTGYNLTQSPSDTDFWLLRTDANGDMIWNRSYGESLVYSTEIGEGLVVCADGGFAIVGTRYGGPEGHAFYLVRTDASGNMQWNKTYRCNSQAHEGDLVQCSDNGFAIVGYSRFYDIGKEQQVVLIRTDSSGNYLWNQTYGGPDDERGYSLLLCADGGFAIGGEYYNRTSSTSDILFMRTDSGGNHLWNHTYGINEFEYFGGMVNCTDGGYALTGGTYNMTSSESDVWLIRTDSLGNQQWTRSFGGHDSEWGATIVDSGSDTFTIAATIWYRDAGHGDFWLFQTYDTPLEWLEEPADQTIEFGTIMHYDLDATSSVSLDVWWINDSTHFTISNQGVITNNSILSVGTYGLQVWVNDTLGNELTNTFSIRVQDTTPPTWVAAPNDQLIWFGTPLDVTFEATDLSGVDYWSVNDTAQFSISALGRLTNIVPLDSGYHYLNISVYDIYANRASAEITITVMPPSPPPTTTPPPIPGFPVETILIGIILGIASVLHYRRRKNEY